MELERFLKNGNKNQGNRFKFIERTAGVENHRGVGAEDGLIRVEFQFEKRAPIVEVDVIKRTIYEDHYGWNHYPPRCGCYPSPYYPYTPTYWYSNTKTTGGSIGDSSFTLTGSNAGLSTLQNSVSNSNSQVNCSGQAVGAVSGKVSGDPVNVNYAQAVYDSAPNDAGVTVPGSISNQAFHDAAWFPKEEQSFVIVLKLLGTNEKGVVVVKPVTVKQKPTCVSCGHVNKAASKFCTECGTSLEIV